MLLVKLFLFSFLCYTAFSKEEDVIDLGDGDFSSKLAEHETALVMFYAPWCGHCKRLKPEYAKAAEELVRNDPPITLFKVDCTEAGKETCNKNSVNGYPTLKIFRNGEFSQEYNGPREASGIVKYMKAQVGPSSKELKTVEELEKFLKSENDVSIVGFFEKESELKTAFLKTADKLRESVRFAHSSYKEVLDKQGLKDNVVLFRPEILKNKFEDNQVVYSGNADSGSIKDFITKNYHGLCGHRKSDNRQDFKNPLVVAYYAVDYVKNPKGTNYWRNRILKVAKEFKDQITFAISSKDELTQELNEYGVDFIKHDKPRVFARDEKNQKFVMEDVFSVEALELFVQDLLDDKLSPYVKSEPIPESNEEPVKVAVAKNFEELVLKNNKDTLIEFYAPWCGHCKKLAPVYDELALKLKDEDVSIVKMDATANDVPPSFDVRGFPTLFWLPKDSKDKPVRYDGGRELDDFVNYIAKHATNELKGYDRAGKPKADKTEL
ncbi:protein disulfide-isomerase A3 [Coccinella septempunctata]|uniref:protein disulfide-isomerase A3 n=1 Tax=Coccinella septempunctata TaxID=41139 RepID=UPI001D069A6F|nr:protein disulfide-isomerase A3 [Coccinella septempunctata]